MMGVGRMRTSSTCIELGKEILGIRTLSDRREHVRKGAGAIQRPRAPRPSSNAASGSVQGWEGKERTWTCSGRRRRWKS